MSMPRTHTAAPARYPRNMTDADALVERSAELKREVLDFAWHPRFDRYLRQELRRQQWRRPDSRTIAELFVDALPDLPQAERTFVLGWPDVVEGIFEVTGRDDVSLSGPSWRRRPATPPKPLQTRARVTIHLPSVARQLVPYLVRLGGHDGDHRIRGTEEPLSADRAGQ